MRARRGERPTGPSRIPVVLGPSVVAAIAFLKIAIILLVIGAAPAVALGAAGAAATYIVVAGARRV